MLIDYAFKLQGLVLYCMVCSAFIILYTWRRGGQSSGLVTAYIVGFLITYLPGALIYCIPEYEPITAYLVGLDFDTVHIYEGFRLMCIGFTAFAAGVFIAGFFGLGRGQSPDLSELREQKDSRKIAFWYIGIGFILNVALESVLRRAPSLAMVSSVSFNFFVMGSILYIWSIVKNRKHLFLFLIFIMAVFPLYTMISDGFLGFAVRAIVPILVFTALFYKPKYHLVIFSAFLVWFGISFFINYIENRDDLRSAVWLQQSKSEALHTIKKMAYDFHFFDPRNFDHLEKIDLRLNQNIFVGRAVEYIQDGNIDFARGETLLYVAASFVPRIIWPSKPSYGGSMNIVSEYTGMKISEGTSMGVGQVMEFYINFGNSGVVVMFLILGLIIHFFDVKAGTHLRNGNYISFVFWFMPGLGFLNSTGLLAESIGTVWISFAVCAVVSEWLMRKQRALLGDHQEHR